MNITTGIKTKKIMFIDDDDLILNLPDLDHKVIIGMHYIPENLDISIDDIKEFEGLEVVNDFSGTIVDTNIALHYLEKMIEITPLSDVTFMDAMEKIEKYKAEPYILHRLWPERTQWCKDTMALLNIISTKLGGLDKRV
jgi:hypothetical protein